MKRKTIGLIVVLSMVPLMALGLLIDRIPFLGSIAPVFAILAYVSGPIGLLIMGPSMDGKPGLLKRILGVVSGFAKWGWLLIPIFPIDVAVAFICIFLGVIVAVFGATLFAFIPALFDFIKTKKALAK